MKIESTKELTTQILDQIVALENRIFDKPLSPDELLVELPNKKGLLILIAFDGNEACGYKVGFEYYSDTFFSWGGGVLSSHRKKGIAKELMALQHQKAKEAGYSYIRTHTKNKYREMLVLNIKSGFDVTGVYKSLKEMNPGIILEKEL